MLCTSNLSDVQSWHTAATQKHSMLLSLTHADTLATGCVGLWQEEYRSCLVSTACMMPLMLQFV